MRIAIACGSFPRSSTEEPVFPAIWELARELKKQGHELLVMTFSDLRRDDDVDGEIDVDGIRVLRRRRVYTNYTALCGLPALAALGHILSDARDLYNSFKSELEKFNPDVIECQEFNTLGLFLAAEHTFPLVVRCYGPLGTLMKAGYTGESSVPDINTVMEVEALPIIVADALIAICNDVSGKLSSLSSRPLEDFTVIRTPLSVPGADLLPEPVREDDSFPVLFFWGNVIPLKGADLLVEALPEVARAFPKVRLLVGGQHSPVFGSEVPYVEVMKARLSELDLLDHVHFLGFMDRPDIIKHVRNADICLFPSRYETACYSALEAMSYGAAVVAARVGGLKEYCHDGKSGLLFESENAADLKEKILTLARDNELRKKLGRDARQHVIDFCSPERAASESLAVYHRAIESYKSGIDRRALAFQRLAASLGTMLDTTTVPQLRSWIIPPPPPPPPPPEPEAQPPAQPPHIIVRAARKMKRIARVSLGL